VAGKEGEKEKTFPNGGKCGRRGVEGLEECSKTGNWRDRDPIGDERKMERSGIDFSGGRGGKEGDQKGKGQRGFSVDMVS